LRLARETGRLVTIEEASAMGGFGSAVAELLHAHDLHDVKLKIIGLPDRFIEHGAPAILRELTGISSGHIKEVARDLLADEAREQESNRAPKSSTRRANKVEQEIG
jgi:1-deoxy-D-xylulose-5-phosphate synthase